MKCYVEHQNYKGFSEIYGDEGVNYVYSLNLDIPLVEQVETLSPHIQKNLEKLRRQKIQSEVRDNLKEIFGNDMSDSDIKFVSELGNSVATFKKSGEILFNSMMLQESGVEYHEAFHRVFRMYLTNKERQDIYNEVIKNNKDKPWSKYDRKTTQEQIEELLADDFMMYSMDKKNKMSKVGQFFFRLYRFIKNFFNRGESLDNLYDKILQGGFQGKYSNQQLLQDANKFELDFIHTNSEGQTANLKYDIEIEDKVKIVDELLHSFTEVLFSTGKVGDNVTFRPYDLFQDKNFDTSDFLTQVINHFLKSSKTGIDDDLRYAVSENFKQKRNGIKQALMERLKDYGIGSKFKEDSEAIIKTEGDDTTDGESSDNAPFEQADKLDAPAFETDPHKSISYMIKLRLSTIKRTDRLSKPSKVNLANKGSSQEDYVTNNYNDYLNYSEVWNKVVKVLCNSPSSFQEMRFLLKKNLPPYINGPVVELLDSSIQAGLDKGDLQFITDFVTTFSKSKYEFARVLIEEDRVRFKELTFGLAAASELKDIQSKLNINHTEYSEHKNISGNKILPLLKRTNESSEADYEAIQGFIKNNGFTLNEVLVALKAAINGNTIDNSYSQKGDEKLHADPDRRVKLSNLKDAFTRYSKNFTDEMGLEETNHTTIGGKPIYDISFDTTLSKNIKLLTFIGGLVKSQGLKYGNVQDYSFNMLSEATRQFRDIIRDENFESALKSIQESKFAPDILLNHYLPHMINPYTFSEIVERNGSGNFISNSVVVDKLLKGQIDISLMVVDGNKETVTDDSAAKEMSELSRTEYNLHYLNLLRENVFPTMKHSDRSTFYNMGFKSSDGKFTDLFDLGSKSSKEEIDNIVSNKLYNYFLLEKNYYKSVVNGSYINNITKYFSTHPKTGRREWKSAFDGMLFENDMESHNKFMEKLEEYFNSEKGLEAFPELDSMIRSKIKEWVIEENQVWKKNLDEDGITSVGGDFGKYMPGKNEGIKEGKPDAIISYAFGNAVLFHMEEQLVLYGHFGQYKNGDDLYKRMNTHSGTGKAFDQSIELFERIREEQYKTEIPLGIFNIHTGEIEEMEGYTKYDNTQEDDYYDSQFTTVQTLSEIEDYHTPDAAKLQSDIQASIESGLEHVLRLEMESRKDLTSEQKEKYIKDQTAARAKLYAKSYTEFNLPDGGSYMNLFYIKEYNQRLGEWTADRERAFQIELKCLSAKNQEEAYAIIKSEYMKDLAYQNNLAKMDKSGKKKSLTLQQLLDKHFTAFEMKKPQYGGPSYLHPDVHALDFKDRGYTYGINKTSFFPLIPSTIAGTNLQQLHFHMLKNAKDVVSMQSATKTGAIDYRTWAKMELKILEDLNSNKAHDLLKELGYTDREPYIQTRFGTDYLSAVRIIKLIAKEGLHTYTEDGAFNEEAIGLISRADNTTQYLSWTYMKDQVKIHTHPKEYIRNSTQSMKNILANQYAPVKINEEMYSIPMDVLKHIRLDMSKEEIQALIDSSFLHKTIQSYVDNLRTYLLNELKGLKDKLAYSDTNKEITNFDTMKKLLVESAEGRNSPKNVIEALELLTESNDKMIETLSNQAKIEPIIYSILTKLVNFKRPGNSIPMAPSQMFEPYARSSESKGGKRLQVSDELKGYRIEDGKVVSAEIMMPLPSYWFKKVIKAVNNRNKEKGLPRVDNIIDAIQIFNEMLANKEREIELKGLRIPNQQYSSTDTLTVKKFFLPIGESFVVVYPEIVAKTGGDLLIVVSTSII